MRFLTLLTELIEQNESNVAFTDNDVRLLAPQAPSQIAEHFLYGPMPEPFLLHLVQSYRRNYPEELLELYAYANGLDLLRTMRKLTEDISLPASLADRPVRRYGGKKSLSDNMWQSFPFRCPVLAVHRRLLV